MLVPAARRRGAARRFETEGREEPDQLRKAGRADQKPQAGERGAQAKSVKVDGDEKPTKSGHNGLEWSVEMLSSQERRAIKSPLQLAHLRGEDRLDLEEEEFALMGESIAASPGEQ